MRSSRRRSTGTLRSVADSALGEAASAVVESTGEPGAGAAAAGTMMHLFANCGARSSVHSSSTSRTPATASTSSARDQRREHRKGDRARVGADVVFRHPAGHLSDQGPRMEVCRHARSGLPGTRALRASTERQRHTLRQTSGMVEAHASLCASIAASAWADRSSGRLLRLPRCSSAAASVSCSPRCRRAAAALLQGRRLRLQRRDGILRSSHPSVSVLGVSRSCTTRCRSRQSVADRQRADWAGRRRLARSVAPCAIG
jgi:hypothetical protein